MNVDKTNVAAPEFKRVCGDCTLCCKLVPVEELLKPANTKCTKQTHKGCSIYGRHPISCKLWECGWLTGMPTSRPDKAHYVIDMATDTISMRARDGDPDRDIEVVQVWVDPDFPDAWKKDQKLHMLIDFFANKGMATIIRYGSDLASVVLSPAISHFSEWIVTEPRKPTKPRAPMKRSLYMALD